MNGEDFVELFKEAVEFGGAKSVNFETKMYEKSVDKMFERLATDLNYKVADKREDKRENTAEDKKEKIYEKHKFQRVSFKTAELASDFASIASKQGVSAIVAPTALKGKWMVEIPYSTVVPVEKECQNDTPKIEYERITSAEIIQKYTKETGTKVDEVESERTNERERNPITGDGLRNSFFNYMDELGTAVSSASKLSRSLSIDDYMKENQSSKSIFKTPLDLQGEARPLTPDVRKSEKAIVLNGNTVVINGEIVTDKKTRDFVLKQHEARMAKANENLEKAYNRDDARKSEALRTGKQVKADTVKQETIRKNSEKIKELAFRQEYVSNQVSTQSNRKGGALDELVNSFNTNAIASSLKTSAIVMSADEVGVLKKALMLAGSEQKVMLTNVMKDGLATTFRERETIIDVLKNAEKNKGVRFSEEEKQTLKELSSDEGKIKLSEQELNIFTSSKQAVESIKKDLGLDFTKGGIGRSDVLKINEKLIARSEAAGLQLVKREKGKAVFDVDAFSKLSPSQLKSLGIGFETQNVVIKLNSPDAWGEKKGSSGLFGMAISGFLKIAEDDELSKTISDMKKIAKPAEYIKSAATSVNNYSKAVRAGIDRRKADKIANTKGSGNLNVTKKDPKKQNLKKQPLKKIDSKANQAFLKQNEKKLAKLARSEKSIFTKVNNVKARIGKKFTQNKVFVFFKGLANKVKLVVAKYVAIAVGGFLLIEGALIVILIVMMSFQSLLNAPITFVDGLLAAKDFEDTACYKIYEHIAENEKNWLDDISNFDTIFKERKRLEYGIDRESWNSYVAKKGNIKLDGNDVFLDPFWRCADAVDKDHYTEIKSYDGTVSTELSSNLNIYGQRNSSAQNAYVGIENGHTSNTKDILAMMDIMFQFEMDMYNDGEMQDILGLSPEQIEWRNATNKAVAVMTSVVEGVKTIAHNVGTFFKNMFSDNDANYENIKDYDFSIKGQTVSYNALLDYVDTLFIYSHSQMFNLSVDYYPVGTIGVNVNGNGVNLDKSDLKQKYASEVHTCLNPVKNKFKLMYNGTKNTIIPVLFANGGGYYDLSNGNHDVTLSMYNGTYADNDQCLWDGMASDKKTADLIKTHISKNPFDACWKETETDKETVYAYEYADETDEDYAKAIAYNKCVEKYNSNIFNPANMGKEGYVLSADRNYFTHEWYKISSSFDVDYEINTYEWRYAYEWEYPEEGSTSMPVQVPRYKTRYQVLAKAKLYTKKTTEYKRTCKGHDFSYCGGHISAHSQGNVLSVTNEQLALNEFYDSEDSIPVVKDLDLKTIGFNKLLGKVDNEDNKVDYKTALTASKTGGSKSALFDVQGSDSSMRGLNLLVGSDGELKKGMEWNGTDIKYFRDIFDADCSIDKGWTVFPFGKKWENYQGWTSDNIGLVASRISQNWGELYEFDIPYEVYGKAETNEPTALSETDVIKISEALKKTYGNDYDKDRQKAVELTLRWVNRGHYNENHPHAFLSAVCQGKSSTVINSNGNASTIRYSANCTASDDKGFAKFILYRTGRINSVVSDITGFNVLGSVNDLEPADILLHDATSDFRQLVLSTRPNNNNAKEAMKALLDYRKQKYVIYIGTLKEDLELSNGQTLYKNIPVTVDMSENIESAGGTIYLRNLKPSNWEDLANDKNYYWVVKPDGKTKVKKFN